MTATAFAPITRHDPHWTRTHPAGFFSTCSEPFDCASWDVLPIYVRRLESKARPGSDERVWVVTTTPCPHCSGTHTLWVGSADHDPVLGRYTVDCPRTVKSHQVVLSFAGGPEARSALVRRPMTDAEREAVARDRAARRRREREVQAAVDADLIEMTLSGPTRPLPPEVQAEVDARVAARRAEHERAEADAEAKREAKIAAARDRARQRARTRRRRRPRRPTPDR